MICAGLQRGRVRWQEPYFSVHWLRCSPTRSCRGAEGTNNFPTPSVEGWKMRISCKCFISVGVGSHSVQTGHTFTTHHSEMLSNVWLYTFNDFLSLRIVRWLGTVILVPSGSSMSNLRIESAFKCSRAS